MEEVQLYNVLFSNVIATYPFKPRNGHLSEKCTDNVAIQKFCIEIAIAILPSKSIEIAIAILLPGISKKLLTIQ